MNNIKVGILDLNAGNIFSVYKVINQVCENVKIVENYNDSNLFTHLIVPGVASFGSAMKTLKEKNFNQLLKEFILEKKPLLGLCVGCQILFDSSSEFGIHNGLSIMSGDVKKLPYHKYDEAKLPNVGWFRVNFDQKNKLFDNVSKDEFFYFTHSFYCEPQNKENILATYKFYEEEIVAGVIKDNTIGLQFHPEMSSYAGKQILKNFLKI